MVKMPDKIFHIPTWSLFFVCLFVLESLSLLEKPKIFSSRLKQQKQVLNLHLLEIRTSKEIIIWLQNRCQFISFAWTNWLVVGAQVKIDFQVPLLWPRDHVRVHVKTTMAAPTEGRKVAAVAPVISKLQVISSFKEEQTQHWRLFSMEQMFPLIFQPALLEAFWWFFDLISCGLTVMDLDRQNIHPTTFPLGTTPQMVLCNNLSDILSYFRFILLNTFVFSQLTKQQTRNQDEKAG